MADDIEPEEPARRRRVVAPGPPGPAPDGPPCPGTVIVFDGKGGVERLVSDGQVPAAGGKGFVAVSGKISAPEFKVWLRETLGQFHADIMSVPSTRSRCTVLEDKAVVVMRVARPGADSEDVGRQFLSLLIEKGRVVVASELNIPEFLGIAQWQLTQYAPLSPADLVARLGLRAADRIEPLVEQLGDRLDEIEVALMREHTRGVANALSRLRRNLIGFRRLVWPLRDVLNTLEIEDLSFLSRRDRTRLREAAARAARLGDELQSLSERAVLVHEQILDTRAEQMNHAMLVLAAVTVVFMPLTVISGALGMNVAGIPFADSPYAFTVVSLGLAAIAALAIWWMRSRRWL